VASRRSLMSASLRNGLHRKSKWRIHAHHSSSPSKTKNVSNWQLYEAFDPREAKSIADKLDIHYTPKHGSWFNMAEIELSHLSRQCLRGRIAAKATLINKVQAWNTQRNAKHAKAHWQFTTDDARVKLRRLYPIVSA
jgi:hypothetical protein